MDPEIEFERFSLRQLASTGEIAAALGATPRQVAYAAQAAAIEPDFRFGNLNVYGRWGQRAIMVQLLRRPLRGGRGPQRRLSPEAQRFVEAFDTAYQRWEGRLQADHEALVAAGLREPESDEPA